MRQLPELQAGWRKWGSIQCPEPPPCYRDHEELLAQAKAMLATRERRFPDLVLRREMTGEAAAAEIAIFSKIVADLEWMEAMRQAPDGFDFDQPIPLTEAERRAICATLDESIATLGELFIESGDAVPARLSDQAHNVIALRWNYDPERGRIGQHGEMHGNARLTGKYRAQARNFHEERGVSA